MANLVNANAANATQVVKGYAYNRSLVKAGILHFGVGNFHRAHLEFMTNKLLENNTQQNWGICGAMYEKHSREKASYSRRQSHRQSSEHPRFPMLGDRPQSYPLLPTG
jgi:hypothetical protein